MKDWWKWPWFVTGATWDRLVTERNCLANALREAQLELRRYKILVADLRNADQATEAAIKRAMAK